MKKKHAYMKRSPAKRGDPAILMIFRENTKKLRNILKYNFLNFKYFFKIVEDLEELDHALQKRLRLFFVSSNFPRTAGANVWVPRKVGILYKNP